MNKTKFILATILLCTGCMNIQAQSLKDILSGMAEKVIGNKATTATSITGTWKYESPDCQFKSDNILAKVGSVAASSKVNDKLKSIYKTLGMENISITFNSDSTYKTTIKDKTTEGTYTFDSENKTITMKNRLGTELKANVTVADGTMGLMFDADKLMNGLKTLTNKAAQVNSTAATISNILGNYSGMTMGIKMKKQ